MVQLRSVMAIGLVVGLAFVGAPAAAETMKHSGLVVMVDEESATLVMHEVGPWKRTPDGQTVLTTLTIAVTEDTEFAMVSRDPPEGASTAGPFVERPIGAWALYEGDFVTVDCRHEGEELIATKITVTDVPSEDPREGP